ncbi:MAG: phosphate ABC transporter permease subunit PstC [Planctomycetaceae bacterium]|nr:phosphate ABC transporter permease subunit PstC [Planctomycetaceae bacterium]
MSPTSQTPLATSAPENWVRTGATSWLMRTKERLIGGFLFLCAFLSVVTTLAIIFVLLDNSVYSFTGGGAFFQRPGVSAWSFLTGTEWHWEDGEYGILPLLWGTFLVAGIAALVGLPIGLASAVYLSEYASPKLRSVLKPVLEILAGIPTIVFGYFALLFITPYVIKPVFQGLLGFDVATYNVLSGGVIVGVMIVPMVCSISEDALRAVPRTLREAAYALGSTKFDVSAKVVVPAALSGIVASFLLAVSRAIGETMAVTLAVGHLPNLSADVLGPAQTMTAYIVNITESEVATGTAEYESLYAVALVLFVTTLLMNVVSQMVTRRYREVYQ